MRREQGLKMKSQSVYESKRIGRHATGIVFALAMVLPGCTKNDDVKTEAVASTKHEVTPMASPDPQAAMSMGFKPIEFKERFNGIAQNVGLEYRVSSVQTTKGSEIADEWIYEFTDRIGLVMPVNRKDGTVRSVTYLATGDGSQRSGEHVVMVLATLIRAIDPALTNETANKLLFDLTDTFKSRERVERVLNGVRYGAIVADGVGLVVAINPSLPVR